MNAVYILWLRQLKRYFRSKSRMVGSLGQPILFLFALGFGMGPIFQKAGQGNYLEFLTPGIVGMSILFTSVFSGIEVIWDKQFGFLKETLVAPVSRFHIMLGRTLGGATVAVFQGLIVLLISIFAGFRPFSIFYLPFSILIMFLIALLFTAVGTAIASVLSDMQGFQLIMNFLVMPLFFLSGAIFPLQTNVPRPLLIIASLDPLSYGIDGLRYALINLTHFGLITDLSVLTLITAFFLFLGSFLFSRIQI
jgi:ABC-2 type transport system permease protein